MCVNGIFLWNENLKAWECRECHETASMNQYYPKLDSPFGASPFDYKQTQPDWGKKCECGSDTVGGAGHSTWCPKWK